MLLTSHDSIPTGYSSRFMSSNTIGFLKIGMWNMREANNELEFQEISVSHGVFP